MSSYYPSPPAIPNRKSTNPFPASSQSGARGYGPSPGAAPSGGVQPPSGRPAYGPSPTAGGYGPSGGVTPSDGRGFGPSSGVSHPAQSAGGYGPSGGVQPAGARVAYGPPSGVSPPVPSAGGYSSDGRGYNASSGVSPPPAHSTGYTADVRGYNASSGVSPPPAHSTGYTADVRGFNASSGVSPAQSAGGYGPSSGAVSYGQGVSPPLNTGPPQGYPQASGYGAYGQPGGVVAPQPNDWFSNTGFATAIGAAAMSAMTGNEAAVKQIMTSTFDSERQKSLSWFQSQIVSLKEYFNVTHSYVRWKLLYILLPFLQSTNTGVSRAVSRDVPSDGSHEENESTGSGVGLRLFPGRKPDLYIPIMGFITFVLAHSLSKWKDFHPDDLYNIASLGILLGCLEILIIKAASYVMNVAHWKVTDIVAVCGYKYANLSVSIMLMASLAFGGRPVWILCYVVAAAMAGLTVHRGLIAAGNYNASSQNYMGVGHSAGMERLISLAAGAAQFLWIWILMPSMKIVAVQTMIAKKVAPPVIESTGTS